MGPMPLSPASVRLQQVGKSPPRAVLIPSPVTTTLCCASRPISSQPFAPFAQFTTDRLPAKLTNRHSVNRHENSPRLEPRHCLGGGLEIPNKTKAIASSRGLLLANMRSLYYRRVLGESRE